MNNDPKHIKIPVWIASILFVALLGVASDTWRNVQTVKSDLCTLKVALKAKGLIENDLCLFEPKTAKLWPFDAAFANQANQGNENLFIFNKKNF